MYSISEMEELNKKIGHFFFSKDTKKFWGSKVCTDANKYNLFITCEDNFDKSKRLYSVRSFSTEGSVNTLYFQNFKTLPEAKSVVKLITKMLDDCTDYREKTILDNLKEIRQDYNYEDGIFIVYDKNDNYFNFNMNNLERFICG